MIPPEFYRYDIMQIVSDSLQHNDSNSPTTSSPHNGEDSTHHDGYINPLRDPQGRRLPRIAGPSNMVIFGMTGGLVRKKFLPVIYDPANHGLLPASFALVSYGRREWSRQDLEDCVRTAAEQGAHTDLRESIWQHLTEGIHFVTDTFTDGGAFDRLTVQLEEFDCSRDIADSWAYYLSIPSADFPGICHQLDRSGLAQSGEDYRRRVIIEKSFGHDLVSIQELNRIVNSIFPEGAVFRIGHYLGRETVQNILAMCFVNQSFDPMWNSRYIDHVQITMAEDIGLGGHAGYYDSIGVARNVIRNCLLQLLALVAMEESIAFISEELRAEKIKAPRAVEPARPFSKYIARDQYIADWQSDNFVPGSRNEEGFDPESTTGTYTACTLQISSRHWAGVPFCLHTSKHLGRRVTEVIPVFKSVPHLPFVEVMAAALGWNAMVVCVQPDGGVLMRSGSKILGSVMEMCDVNMDFSYFEVFTEQPPGAYKYLVLSTLLDGVSLFPTNEEAELSQKILDPIVEYWVRCGRPEGYSVGSWGPSSADHMLERDGRIWRRPWVADLSVLKNFLTEKTSSWLSIYQTLVP